MHLDLNVFEKDLGKISVGQEVKLELLRGQALSLEIYGEKIELKDFYVTKTK